MIDQVKGGVEISDSIEDVNIPGTFDEIDELLNKLYTGDPSSEDKKVFLMGLYHSEKFYQRVLLKMGQLVPALEEELLPSLTDIQIQSDEQILANMNVLTSSKGPAKVDLSYKIPLKFWEKVKKILRSGSPGARRWVYATVSLSILLIATLSGIRFYNTSYQIMLAEDLLQENYRIYMADTPRLSGGYGSTGISQLMGDDDETYINKALAHIIQALDNESTSSRVQEIQAQIFIINKDLYHQDIITVCGNH